MTGHNLDLVDASWASIGTDDYDREAVRQLQETGILQSVTPADVLVQGEQAHPAS